MIDVATASWLQLSILTLVLLGLFGAAWGFAGWWASMWRESLMSRTVDRRFLRWQHFAFRGHYPLGHWRKPGASEHLEAFVFIWRGVILAMLILYLIALGMRITTSLRSSELNLSNIPIANEATDSPSRALGAPHNNRLQATVGGLGVDMPARWAFAHRA